MHEQNCQQQCLVFWADPDKAATLVKVGLLDALAKIRFVFSTSLATVSLWPE